MLHKELLLTSTRQQEPVVLTIGQGFRQWGCNLPINCGSFDRVPFWKNGSGKKCALNSVRCFVNTNGAYANVVDLTAAFEKDIQIVFEGYSKKLVKTSSGGTTFDDGTPSTGDAFNMNASTVGQTRTLTFTPPQTAICNTYDAPFGKGALC